MSHWILVVDDDRDIRDTMCELLTDDGHQVACAENGAEALAVLRSGKKICVVLLDLMMPVMNGWEFRKHQLDDPALANIPVVVITAGSDGRGLGDVVLLTKPLALETILAHVHAIC